MPDEKIETALIESMQPLDVNYAEGAGSTDQVLVEAECPRCGRVGTVRYTGSDMLEGSLLNYHLVHTEVRHHLRCLGCGAKWAVFKML